MSVQTLSRTYPIRLGAELDPRTSRGLWLVKWLLAIPHYVVLAFLWIAFVVTSVIAFVAILITGRYPRALFDFNVGVLRWSWRVSFYAYGALGTDRYPPFTLHDVSDYPAHLDVDYPDHLSRGLVLVKSWLLAIPHYLVLSVLLGGAAYVAPDEAREPASGLGLIGVLVLVAAVVLLVTGRYPPRVFDLVVGLNRWVFRVIGYVSLMTDEYPPFALDQGGRDPGPLDLDPASPQAAPDPAREQVTSATATAGLAPQHAERGRSSGWTTGRVVSLTIGSLFVITGLGLAAAAGTAGWIDQQARDRDGFVMTDDMAFDTPGSAIVSPSFRLHTDVPGDFLPARLIGDTRLTVDPDPDTDVFVGIGATDDVEAYLADTSYDVVSRVHDDAPVYRTHVGDATPSAPAEQDFWTVQATGPGQQTLTWEPAEGQWSYVLMNADASPVVEADLALGAELPILDRVTTVTALLAAVTLLLGIALILIPLRAASAAVATSTP